ncbi:response regulator [Croceibacterium mercuriale]|uniref:Response regulator n=1 Tax=Croceibacterium mercuriale TaxID=1572751 RepID=A0A0B2BTI5_9SPHN|nr:response regulator [Croceibacterium mercuriale]KHL24878.1 response regulator [Croceibacterium mercuriale]
MLVLFVEDDPMNRRVVRDMLRVVGATMEEAEEAESGLRMLAAKPYDMVLMDLRMPGMDGITAIGLLRGTIGPNQSAPVIVVTADMAPDLRTRCLAAGADEVIVKPVAMAALLDAMARLAPREAEEDFVID